MSLLHVISKAFTSIIKKLYKWASEKKTVKSRLVSGKDTKQQIMYSQ